MASDEGEDFATAYERLGSLSEPEIFELADEGGAEDGWNAFTPSVDGAQLVFASPARRSSRTVMRQAIGVLEGAVGFLAILALVGGSSLSLLLVVPVLLVSIQVVSDVAVRLRMRQVRRSRTADAADHAVRLEGSDPQEAIRRYRALLPEAPKMLRDAILVRIIYVASRADRLDDAKAALGEMTGGARRPLQAALSETPDAPSIAVSERTVVMRMHLWWVSAVWASSAGALLVTLAAIHHYRGNFLHSAELSRRLWRFSRQPMFALNRACSLARVNQLDEAVHWVEVALNAGYSPEAAAADPDLEALHSDQRFVALTTARATE